MNRRAFLLAAAASASPARIRAGLLGTRHSHAAGKLKTLLDNPDYEVAAVCEPDPATRKLRETQALYQGLRFVSQDQLLADRSIQLVAVEGQAWDNFAAGQQVIAAGKHLHLEKPPTHQMAPFRELVEEARRRNLLLQTGYIWRFHQGFAAAFEAARQGWLGEVYMLRGVMNTDLNEASRTDIARYAGGMMFELGGHMIDRVVDLWGRPREVRSWIKGPDNTLAVLEYERSLAVLSTSSRMPGHTAHRGFELLGTDGAILLNPPEPGIKMKVTLRAARGPYRAGWQEIDLPPQPRYIGDFQDLARALKTGQPLKYSYDFELLVQETLLRASS